MISFPRQAFCFDVNCARIWQRRKAGRDAEARIDSIDDDADKVSYVDAKWLAKHVRQLRAALIRIGEAGNDELYEAGGIARAALRAGDEL